MQDDKRQCLEEPQIPDLCKQCEARHRGICGALNADELIELNRVSIQRSFGAGQILMADEEEMPFFASVLKGVIKLSKTLADGRQQIVGLQFAPDFLGRPYHKESQMSVETATEVDLCTTSRRYFERMIASSPDLQSRLFRQTLKDLDESREWLVTLGRKTARERVASFLCMIAHNGPGSYEGEPPVTVFDLPLTRADMADFLGLTIETVSRQLTKLKKDKIISISHNRHIIITDMKRLQQAMEE